MVHGERSEHIDVVDDSAQTAHTDKYGKPSTKKPHSCTVRRNNKTICRTSRNNNKLSNRTKWQLVGNLCVTLPYIPTRPLVLEFRNTSVTVPQELGTHIKKMGL